MEANNDMSLVVYSPLLKGFYAGEEKKKRYDWDAFNNGKSLERIQLIEKTSKATGIFGNQLVLSFQSYNRVS